MLSDEQLMLEFKAGNTEAFDELFQRYRNPIDAFFRRRLNTANRAEDMTQETFVVILRGADRYEPRAKFRTYLYAIALKLLSSERRREFGEPRPLYEVAEPRTGSDSTAGIWIREAMEGLAADHREVLMLREYEQLSYDWISELLSIPVNTVRSFSADSFRPDGDSHDKSHDDDQGIRRRAHQDRSICSPVTRIYRGSDRTRRYRSRSFAIGNIATSPRPGGLCFE